MVEITVMIDGKPLDAYGADDAPLKTMWARFAKHVRDRIRGITCPVHGKHAERVLIEVDRKTGIGRSRADGFCCNRLRTLVESALLE